MIVKKWIYLKKNTLHRGFSSSSVGKKSACNAGGSGSIPGLERSPVEGIDYPLQYSCLQNPHGQRSLAGYSPRGHGKESDMTEQLSTAQHSTLHKQNMGHLRRRESPKYGVVTFYGLGNFTEKAMAPHSSTLAWKIPWAEEPGRLQSMGWLRVGHD